MIDALILLYAGNTIIAALAYVPQISKLLRTKGKPQNFSVTRWIMWTYSTAIATLYATLIT